MHAPKRRLGAFRGFQFFRFGERQVVIGRDKIAPMQPAAIRMAGKMSGAKIVRQTDLGRLLAQEGCAEIGALGDIDPAECRRRSQETGRRRQIFGNAAEIDNILAKRLEAVAIGKAG
jgi:hypothetical protein